MEIKWDEMNKYQKDFVTEQYIYIMANKNGISEEEAKASYDTSDSIMSSFTYIIQDDGDILIDI